MISEKSAGGIPFTCEQEGVKALPQNALARGRHKDLFALFTDQAGNPYKDMRSFLDSKILGVGHSQGEKLIRAWEYVQVHKIEIKRAVEIGVEKLSLGMRLDSRHPGGVKPEVLEKESKRDLQVIAGHPRELTIYFSEEEVYNVVEQAISTYIKEEGGGTPAQALEHICADWLSGKGWEHAERKQTTQEKMRELWEYYKDLKGWGKSADINFTSWAMCLKKMSTIPD